MFMIIYTWGPKNKFSESFSKCHVHLIGGQNHCQMDRRCFSIKPIKREMPPHIRNSEVFCNWHRNNSAVRVSPGTWRRWREGGKEGRLRKRSNTFIALPSAITSRPGLLGFASLSEESKVGSPAEITTPHTTVNGPLTETWNGPPAS